MQPYKALTNLTAKLRKRSLTTITHNSQSMSYLSYLITFNTNSAFLARPALHLTVIHHGLSKDLHPHSFSHFFQFL